MAEVTLDLDGPPGRVADAAARYRLAVEARIGTLRGRQIMRPGYGLDLSDMVGRNLEGPDYREVRRRVNVALRGLLSGQASIDVEAEANEIVVRAAIGETGS